MKTIIFRNKQDLIWLHPKDIIRIYVHKFNVYTETSIYLKKFTIQINDHYHGDFIGLLYDFIRSDEILKEMKVADLKVEKNYAFFRMYDWITQITGDL